MEYSRIGNKVKDFWKFIGEYDFISLNETWLEKERWDRLKNKLPKTHIWACSEAKRVKTRGKAKGGMIIGKRKD